MAAVFPDTAFKGMDFMKLEFRQRLLSSTLLVGASLVATPALAAQPLPAPAQDEMDPPETIADIIVTGSRIPQPNLESASPVTVVTSQEVKISGTSRTEDLINSLPQVFATQGSNISNGASGTATISLRGLGSVRSLVLVNGKRLQAGDTGNPVPDINFIPAAMIKRVDVLTGGASSVYGADAVAGVVNFIMDTSFTGFRIDGQASFFNHHNDTNSDVLAANEPQGFNPPRGWTNGGGAQDISGVFGAAFDDGRGHVTAYASYRNQEAVLQSTRDFSYCALNGLTQTQINNLGRRFQLLRLGHFGERHVPAVRSEHLRQHWRLPGEWRPVRAGIDAVQLQPVQLLPASERALQSRRVRGLRDQPVVQALCRADVHGRHDERGHRAVGQLRRHEPDRLRQRASVGAAARSHLRARQDICRSAQW
jgi:hypothetical protein